MMSLCALRGGKHSRQEVLDLLWGRKRFQSGPSETRGDVQRKEDLKLANSGKVDEGKKRDREGNNDYPTRTLLISSRGTTAR